MTGFALGFLSLSLAPQPDELLTLVAWLGVLAWFVRYALPGLARGLADGGDARAEALTLVALFASALALRLTLPWGPVSFGEAERLDTLWSARPTPCATMCTVPVAAAMAQALGLPLAAILRAAPPLFGALGVTGAYLFARGAGMRRESGVLAALIVLGWPAHLHYSTSLTFTVEGTALWSLAFAAAHARTGDIPARAPLLAALAVLGVYARPEYRLLLVPLAIVALAAPWSWRERGVCGALLAVGLSHYARYLAPSDAMRYASGASRFFFPRLFGDDALSPYWWFYLGALGVAAGVTARARIATSVALALSFASLLWIYSYLASEANPRWSQWRYYAALIPFVAVAVAMLGDRLGSREGAPWRRAVVPALLTLAALTPVPQLYALRRAEDQAAEFAWIRESAPRALGRRTDVLLLTNGGHAGLSHVRVEGPPRMALATRYAPLDWPGACEPSPSSQVRLRDLERVVDECPATISPERSAVYLGLSRDDARIARLLRSFQLVPLEERTLRVAMSSTMTNLQCPVAFGVDGIVGLWAPDCRVRLGWYRLVPRPAP